MIKNRQFRINKSELNRAASLPELINRVVGEEALRWYIGGIQKDEIILEATLYKGAAKRDVDAVERRDFPDRTAVVNIIPTGVGCRIGGYAGDAAPVTNLLATTVDYLVTNPNAVNASDFIRLDRNVVYTDGASIDLLCQGLVDLHLPYQNRIGLIIEKSEEWKLDLVFNVINAVRAVHGVDIVDFIITNEPIGSRCIENESGAFVGTVDNPQVILSACEKLIAKGANAIAVTTNVQDLPMGNYAMHFQGEYPNPIGGVEAIISYLINRQFQIPVAHAPMLNVKQLDLRHKIVDARGAGEMASLSGLACILVGLQRSPQTKPRANRRTAGLINVRNLVAIVAPASCLGGVPVLFAQQYDLPVIAVHENATILDVTQEKLQLDNVIGVSSYAEAAGIILALKNGITPQSLSRPLPTLRY
jgi:hypothetical protein